MNIRRVSESNSTMKSSVNQTGLALALAVLLGGVPVGRALGQTVPGATNPAPKIQFAEILHDFGRVANGAVVKHEYVFTNVGTAPLIIHHVQASCGCTAPGNWSREVAPGATGRIPIQFNSANFNGLVFKNVTVTCNDPAQSSVALQFKATVWKELEISPMFAVINVIGDATTPASATVRIANNLPEPLAVYAPASNLKTFTVEIVTNAPGKEFNLIIKTVPPLAPGNIQGQISFKTSSTNHPTMSLPVLAVVQPAVVVSPAQITLPGEAPAQPQSFVVAIRNQSPTVFTVSEPASNAGSVVVVVKEIEAGRQYNLEATFPAGYNIPPGQTLEITARSTHPSHPIIKIPVNQLPKLRPPGAP